MCRRTNVFMRSSPSIQGRFWTDKANASRTYSTLPWMNRMEDAFYAWNAIWEPCLPSPTPTKKTCPSPDTVPWWEEDDWMEGKTHSLYHRPIKRWRALEEPSPLLASCWGLWGGTIAVATSPTYCDVPFWQFCTKPLRLSPYPNRTCANLSKNPAHFFYLEAPLQILAVWLTDCS